MLRPTDKLHRHFPYPGELLVCTWRSVSPTAFPLPDAAGCTRAPAPPRLHSRTSTRSPAPARLRLRPLACACARSPVPSPVHVHPSTSTLACPPARLHPLACARSPAPARLHPRTSTLARLPARLHPPACTRSSPAPAHLHLLACARTRLPAPAPACLRPLGSRAPPPSHVHPRTSTRLPAPACLHPLARPPSHVHARTFVTSPAGSSDDVGTEKNGSWFHSGHRTASRANSVDPEKALATIQSHVPLKPVRNPPKTSIFDYFPFLRIFLVFTRCCHRKKNVRCDALWRKIKPSFTESNVPLEITIYLNSYLAYLLRNGWLQPALTTGLMNNIASLQDTLSNLDRIGNTPLPFAYQAHLRMLYIPDPHP
ncbi:hypothetical protein B0H14DRAFT_3456131 [Mycena olivaceomarginata]|nr:hypothetical protein B0H14DRAFT_3456131 [Mycena olivaceomarginata]